MRLYVGGLPYQTTEQDLGDFFAQIGEVTQASVITDRETGRSKGFGFVEMASDEEAQAAIAQLNGSMLGNRTITVNEARERQASGNRGFQGRDNYSRNDRY
ncbi:RNA-binding protein [Dictyobacter vulcani]|uniref:RNA-binding protein n=1 Tax=Dictyobacter vulcani TaxID=2607529 RepID=A0A5J4KYE8_9CHLR|nr:RNA-binding protein [Dictyobacter vulcani]GER92102.1 RNA-binding protein [Dictyobacter vulcani]